MSNLCKVFYDYKLIDSIKISKLYKVFRVEHKNDLSFWR